jgi:hypothetical protein
MNTPTSKGTAAEMLRGLADVLAANPDMPKPTVSFCSSIDWYTALTAKEVATVIRVLGGKWTKNDPNSGRSYDVGTAVFSTKFMGYPAEIHTSREYVCTRKVVGTREVTRTFPLTTVEVTVTEDIIEWECHPVLARAS